MLRIAPMSNQHRKIEAKRGSRGPGRIRLGLLSAVCLASLAAAHGQGNSAAPADHGEVLDRVIAVVNKQVILQSDLALEMRLYQMLPLGDAEEATPPRTMERLTTRALIEQQIVQEDPKGMEVSPEELESGLSELRQNLPACKHRDCTSPAGWAEYLKSLGLAPEEVANYWSNRIAILRFIEQRFRSGIRIAPEEIEKYYREQVVPRYARPEDAPALDRVSPRIQEILLQQQVNALMNDWLKSLQQQGEVEVLDPALRVAGTPTGSAAANPGGASSAAPTGPAGSQVGLDRRSVPPQANPDVPTQMRRRGGGL